MTTDNLTPRGPFETGRDAYEAARVLREQIGAATPGGDMTQAVISARSKARVQYLRGVLEVAGVELGAFDKTIVEWVASWDLETIQAIAGWIQRANPRHADEPDMHPWDAPDATALVDVRDDSATVLHALPPIDFPGRIAGTEPGPRCGAQQGRTALFMADVTCPACLEQLGESAACGRCRHPFDPADTAFDGRARYRDTKFCRGCVDACHEADADHRCVICAPGGAR